MTALEQTEAQIDKMWKTGRAAVGRGNRRWTVDKVEGTEFVCNRMLIITTSSSSWAHRHQRLRKRRAICQSNRKPHLQFEKVCSRRRKLRSVGSERLRILLTRHKEIYYGCLSPQKHLLECRGIGYQTATDKKGEYLLVGLQGGARGEIELLLTHDDWGDSSSNIDKRASAFCFTKNDLPIKRLLWSTSLSSCNWIL